MDDDNMEKVIENPLREQVAESIYIQGIKRALGFKELLDDAKKAAQQQRKYLQGVEAQIEEQEKNELYMEEMEVFLPYDFKDGESSRLWLKDVFLEEARQESDDDDRDVTEEEYMEMLKLHKRRNVCKAKMSSASSLARYMYYSSDFITGEDKWRKHHKSFKTAEKKKRVKSETQNRISAELMDRSISNTQSMGNDADNDSHPTAQFSSLHPRTSLSAASSQVPLPKKKKAVSSDMVRKRLWKFIAKKEIPKAFRVKSQIRSNNVAMVKKLSREVMKKQRTATAISVKVSKDKIGQARRITREMQMFWKKYSKVEKVHRKKAEKHALERIKLDEEIREAKRQQRKLNFLISQTELFAHFISKKLSKQQDGGDLDERMKSILSDLEKDCLDVDKISEVDVDEQNESYCEKAMQNVKKALDLQKKQTETFDSSKDAEDNFSESYSLVNPSISANEEIKQPALFSGVLKCYQLKGMNWLINLYEQGINGILADEMGLGKTVQTIAFFGHLAEKVNIWGPFLVVAPASTLNNWHQEFTRFAPKFKVLPYWGNTADRKVLRKFWNQKASHHSDRHSAPFHVLITSYQLVISDVRYFQRIKWQYMVLDEAQALKSSSSVRWRILLDFSCRNRLLLTGTPIQNTMAELWALLHFIMPSLFDSHEEFNEWFSKDIENHIENKANIDEKQLSRLHMILKPFMLRRIKRDVENELSEKIEIRVHCGLTPRQKILYDAIKQNIRLDDLLRLTGSTVVNSNSSTTLMNLVMQFRKVCNHPDLFERREVASPLHFTPLSPYRLPRLVYHNGILSRINPTKRKLLYCDLSIHHPYNTLTSLRCEQDYDTFSFLYILNISASQYWNVWRNGLHHQLHVNDTLLDTMHTRYFNDIFHDVKFLKAIDEAGDDISHKQTGWGNVVYEENKQCAKSQSDGLLLLLPCMLSKFSPASPFDVLIFTQNSKSFYTHSETIVHLVSHIESGHCDMQGTVTVLRELHKLLMPVILQTIFMPSITAKVREIYCCDRGACNEIDSQSPYGEFDSPRPLLSSGNVSKKSMQIFPCFKGFDLSDLRPSCGWSNIHIPEKEYLVTDSGKLYALDIMLKRLKKERHRVLIYSQMTRMIDILEEYMWYRRHTYMRLDGSSRISERRDMVADFQSRSDIFVFLLSTRAGGLGINLTAADTVIFYDSDWNPTVDQQAMDRAHRLGQTKQVTVYRLVCQDTVDERILQRAEEKSAIQRMVIAGGNFHPDTLKPKEVVSLLLDDEQLAQRLKMRKEENRGEGLPYRGKKRGRKSNAEREAKRLKDMQEQGLTDSTDNVTVIHSASSTPPSMRISSEDKGKFSIFSSSPAIDPDSLPYLDSGPASPASEISASSDHRIVEDDLIIVDDVSPTPNPDPRLIRGRGTRRSRGRPRIRPLIPEAPKRAYNRSSSSNRGRPRGSRLRRGRKFITGRAAAMAGARAGAAAASAAAYAAYGYGMEASSNTVLPPRDKTVSNSNSFT